MPPTPIAASRLMAPVGIESTRTRASADPIFMMAPLPQFFSIWAIARFNAFFLSSLTVDTAIYFTLVVGRSIPEQNTKISRYWQESGTEFLHTKSLGPLPDAPSPLPHPPFPP